MKFSCYWFSAETRAQIPQILCAAFRLAVNYLQCGRCFDVNTESPLEEVWHQSLHRLFLNYNTLPFIFCTSFPRCLIVPVHEFSTWREWMLTHETDSWFSATFRSPGCPRAAYSISEWSSVNNVNILTLKQTSKSKQGCSNIFAFCDTTSRLYKLIDSRALSQTTGVCTNLQVYMLLAVLQLKNVLFSLKEIYSADSKHTALPADEMQSTANKASFIYPALKVWQTHHVY